MTAQHLRAGELPACVFPDDVERRYDRSFGNFAQMVQSGKIWRRLKKIPRNITWMSRGIRVFRIVTDNATSRFGIGHYIEGLRGAFNTDRKTHVTALLSFVY